MAVMTVACKVRSHLLRSVQDISHPAPSFEGKSVQWIFQKWILAGTFLWFWTFVWHSRMRMKVFEVSSGLLTFRSYSSFK